MTAFDIVESRRTRGPIERLNDWVNVLDYGAIGDGDNDDTAAIQAAINVALAASTLTKSAHVFFPPGRYEVRAPGLVCSDNARGVMLVGAGRHATEIRFQTGSTVHGLTWENATAYGKGGGIRDMKLWGPAAASVFDLVYVSNWQTWRMTNVEATVCTRNCLSLWDVTDIGVQDCTLTHAAGSGLYIDATGGNISTTVNVTGGYIANNTGPGADALGLTITFTGTVFESNGIGTGAEGLRFRMGTVSCLGCYWEDNAGDDLNTGYDAVQTYGTAAVVVNPFMQGAGGSKGAGKGGLRCTRGEMTVVGPGTWLNLPWWSIVANKANGAKVTLLGLPSTVAPEPLYDDASPLNPIYTLGGIQIRNVTMTSGAGSPEGVVTAPVSSIYLRTDGGAGTSLYVKQTGAGNTGWVGK